MNIANLSKRYRTLPTTIYYYQEANMDDEDDYTAFLTGAMANVNVTARYLGCTPSAIRAWVGKNKIPFTKVNRLTKFRKSDLDDWLERNTVRA
jgi:excisionase family DNA binding protein